MGRKSVAVLDIRSSEVSVIVGERGVNNTFVFKAIHTEEYDGYDESVFLDEAGLASAIVSSVTAVERICGERIRGLYVGVPGAFTRVVPKEQLVGFPKNRTIGQRELDALFASGQKALISFAPPFKSSISSILPRRELMSPITSPINSSGVVISSFIIGSSSTGLAFLIPSLVAKAPASLKASSEESTS